MMRTIWIAVLSLLLTSMVFAQSSESRWQRSSESANVELRLLHSTQSLNLPTAETMQRGDFEFEISHRFFPFIEDGADELWGFDGPTAIRFGLSYAPVNKVMVSLGRSNLNDNLDLRIKVKALQFRSDRLPILIAGRIGVAWNPEDVPGRSRTDSRTFQYYAQGIVNVLLADRFGLGVVPGVVRNSDIFSQDVEESYSIGLNGQVYFGRKWSLLGEWIPVVAGYRDGHNAAALGIELGTGGHFFKIIVTNSAKLNPTQVMIGTPDRFEDNDLRFGFNVTRIL